MENPKYLPNFTGPELSQIMVNALAENDYESAEQISQEQLRRHQLGLQALKDRIGLPQPEGEV